MNKHTCFGLLIVALTLASCSLTSHLPEGETLYTGLKGIVYIYSVANDVLL